MAESSTTPEDLEMQEGLPVGSYHLEDPISGGISDGKIMPHRICDKPQ